MPRLLRTIWPRVRRVLPVRLYPLMAPLARWERSRVLKRLERDDRQIRAEQPHCLAPPPRLRVNVVGECTIPQFLEGGLRTAEEIERALGSIGRTVGSAERQFRGGEDVFHRTDGTEGPRYEQSFLDFGCGCGRLLLSVRHRWPGVKLFGSDVDAQAIAWCRDALPEVGLAVNQALPPLPFETAAFDLIWAGSVFTHLDEERQDLWLAELRRVLKPGGLLLASVHGTHCWEGLPARTVSQIREQGFVYAQTSNRGIHPDWYQTAWHTEGYVREHWRRHFEIGSYLPRGFANSQDIVVAQTRGSSEVT